jgi:GxxExxY protein
VPPDIHARSFSGTRESRESTRIKWLKSFTRKRATRLLAAALRCTTRRAAGFWNRFIKNAWVSEFEHQRIPAIAKRSLTLSCRGRILKQTYEPDYVCFGKIIVELKAVSALTDEHRAQLLNYLHATGFELGLLVNFGHYPGLEYERIAKTQYIKTKLEFSDVSL